MTSMPSAYSMIKLFELPRIGLDGTVKFVTLKKPMVTTSLAEFGSSIANYIYYLEDTETQSKNDSGLQNVLLKGRYTVGNWAQLVIEVAKK